ncbi:SOS-response repressor and protease LexA [Sporomusa ovata]|uniref:SOS-response repressor and protease LexA n=1 Tax=Sporomusa ovata TaxID=2378 RepID=A0A0U1L2B4_9FIRM|nr:S24 family peptidase [Sporomusa ovata]CQR73806.1 SOS-response repressor and protease LexA [Sporomusa ovata]
MATKDSNSSSLVGLVTAGQPILAVENVEETYPLPAELIGSEDNVFMLSVKGEYDQRWYFRRRLLNCLATEQCK